MPLTGTPLDDDMIQTAGRLAGEEDDRASSATGATIEALWIFEVPMALPIDARLPDAQLERARAALRRAKAVGEEYEGVEVATATVRARRAGAAIVEEAKRRGRAGDRAGRRGAVAIRGGALLGGRGGPMDNFVGEVTKYVVSKAPCEVILTAPPASDVRRADADGHPSRPGGGRRATAASAPRRRSRRSIACGGSAQSRCQRSSSSSARVASALRRPHLAGRRP